MVTTSGSTGVPKRVQLSAAAQAAGAMFLAGHVLMLPVVLLRPGEYTQCEYFPQGTEITR